MDLQAAVLQPHCHVAVFFTIDSVITSQHTTVHQHRWFIGATTCVGCDIVQADHAPEAGVAQGIFHGILLRHHGRNQEEVEEVLEEEVERLDEENTQEQVRMPMTMDGNEDTQTRLEPM